MLVDMTYIFMEVIDPEMIQGWERFVVSVAITTVSWIFVTLLVPPASQGAVDQLKRELTGSEGLARVIRLDLLLALLSSLAIYGMLFSIGSIIYSDLIDFMVWLGIAIVSGLTALFLWKYRINKFS